MAGYAALCGGPAVAAVAVRGRVVCSETGGNNVICSVELVGAVCDMAGTVLTVTSAVLADIQLG